MDPFEYAVGLISIVVGLAIGDMGSSLHKLLRHRRTVRWDLRLVLSATYVFLVVTGMWFQFWNVRTRVDILDYALFISIVLELFVAFLMAAAALPDEPAAGLDLAQFYEENGRSLWTLVALFHLSFLAHWIFFVATGTRTRSTAWLWENGLIGGVPLLLAAMLAVRPGMRRLHLLTIVALLGLQLFDLSGSTLR